MGNKKKSGSSSGIRQRFEDFNEGIVSGTGGNAVDQIAERKMQAWLNSDDIEKVMKQYEHTYPCFRFIGPTPIDFDKHIYEDKCVWDDLCKFDLLSYINDGINKIGIIFNTDPHDKSGAHWISLFIDLIILLIVFEVKNGVSPKHTSTRPVNFLSKKEAFLTA